MFNYSWQSNNDNDRVIFIGRMSTLNGCWKCSARRGRREYTDGFFPPIDSAVVGERAGIFATCVGGSIATGTRRNIYKILNPYDGYDPGVRGTIGNRWARRCARAAGTTAASAHTSGSIWHGSRIEVPDFQGEFVNFPCSGRLYVAPSAWPRINTLRHPHCSQPACPFVPINDWSWPDRDRWVRRDRTPQPHSTKSMKYLTALLIPSVVHESAPRRKFISREVRCSTRTRAPKPRVPSPPLPQPAPHNYRILRYILSVSLRSMGVVTSNGTYAGPSEPGNVCRNVRQLPPH